MICSVFNGKPRYYCTIKFSNHTIGGVSSNRYKGESIRKREWGYVAQSESKANSELRMAH